MMNISWDIANFNISMKSQYSDIYELENDISNFFGSSNFSEMDSLDWFLINKKTNELSFFVVERSFFFLKHQASVMPLMLTHYEK